MSADDDGGDETAVHPLSIPGEPMPDVVRRQIDKHLDQYRVDVEIARMEATMNDDGRGVVAIWHGAAYSLGFSEDTEAGTFTEFQCSCMDEDDDEETGPDGDV